MSCGFISKYFSMLSPKKKKKEDIPAEKQLIPDK